MRRVAYLRLGGAGLANCAVELTTRDRSSSGGFKWKLVRLSVGLALEQVGHYTYHLTATR